MNYQARRLTQDLVAAALESSAHHEKLAAESRRLAGTEKVASESQPMDDSYSTELVEKLASAVEEILPEVELKEAGALESIGDTVARGATRAADFASKHNTGAGAAIARNLQKVQGVDNRTLGKAALGVAGVGAAGVGAGMAAHKAMGSNEKKAAEDDAKVALLLDAGLKGVADKVRSGAGKAGDKVKSGLKRGKELLTGSKADHLSDSMRQSYANWLRTPRRSGESDLVADQVIDKGMAWGKEKAKVYATRGAAGVGVGAAALGAHKAMKSKGGDEKKEASVDPEKLAGAVEKIKSGLKRGKELLSGSKLDALKARAADPVRKIESEITGFDPMKRISKEHKKVVGARAAAGVGAAATTAGAGLAAHKAMSNEKKAALSPKEVAYAHLLLNPVPGSGIGAFKALHENQEGASEAEAGQMGKEQGSQAGRRAGLALGAIPGGLTGALIGLGAGAVQGTSLAGGALRGGLLGGGVGGGLGYALGHLGGGLGGGHVARSKYRANQRKEAGLATFLSSKRASLVEMAEGKSFQQSPPSSNPQPTVTDVDQKPTNASGNHLPTNESAVQFSNRKTLPERRASMRNYFSQPMNDQHDVPEFSHKTASASDEARALLSQLAEGK